MTRSILLAALVFSLALNAWQFAKTKGAGSSEEDTASHDGRTAAGPSALDKKTESADEGSKTAAGSDADDAGFDLESVLAIRDPFERMGALLSHIQTLPADEIEPFLKRLREGGGKPDPETQLVARLLLNRWGQLDPEAAFASLGNVTAKRGGEDAVAVLAGLASVDPERAAAWLTDPDNAIASQPYLDWRLAETVAAEWARRDPDAALAWAAELPEGRGRGGALAGIISNIVDTDPARAAELAMGFEGSERGLLVRQVAESWAARSPEDAIAWASSLEDGHRENALREVLGGWAGTDPAAAAGYIDTLPEAERGAHLRDVAVQWSQRAPADAAAWLGGQPENSGKTEAMGFVMWHWTSSDPTAASTWLSDQPRGASYDSGVGGLAKAATHAFEDAAAGVAWANTIEDEAMRGRMMNHTLGMWRRQDRQAAEAWAAENNVELPGDR
jgi:hypothetical protein